VTAVSVVIDGDSLEREHCSTLSDRGAQLKPTEIEAAGKDCPVSGKEKKVAAMQMTDGNSAVCAEVTT
jgi:acetyl-CoA acetyltransferase